ncbi:glycosyltransferase [Ferruginibacter sp.]|nr:glycosyltransferase [Ferruginibacter sp.]
MKVIIIGPAHPLRGGGMATFNERLARQFMQEGFDTSIYTFSLQYPSFIFPGTSQYSEEPAPKDLNIKVCINSINPFNWIKVGYRLKKEKADLIVVRYWLPLMGPCLGTILRIAKKNKHSKIVCIADNVIPHEKRFGDKPFTKYFVNPVDAFVVMSEKVLSDLRLFTKDKPAQMVLHPLYDNFGEKISKEIARKKLGINDNEFIILFFGFIRNYKGLDILLDAVKILKDKEYSNFNFKVLVAGEFYEDKKKYDIQIEKLGIKENLILHTHFISDSEVKYYFCAADVVVQPYRNATQSGVTPLAFHFEIPTIVTNVGALPVMLAGNLAGLIAEPNAESIAENIINYFTLPIGHYLPKLIEEKQKYSWFKLVYAILTLSKK